MADLAKLVVKLEADNQKLLRKLDSSQKKVKRFEKKTSKSAQGVGRAFGKMAAVIGGAATANAFKNFISNSITAGAAINGFAQLANSTTGEFQKWGFAVASVGITHEKLADILKDVNDKVGDFMQTGAGPLADFFENIAPAVGVTAKQFQGLSGQQALGLYVDTLEKANVSQSEMTFFMEAIASDATLLAPLLANDAKRLNELANEAERLGLILSSKTIKQFKQFENQLTVTDALTTNFGQRIAAETLGPLSEMNGLIQDFATDSSAAQTIGAALGTMLKGVASAGIAVSSTFANVGRAIGGLAAAAGAAATGEFSQAGAIIDAVTADNKAASAKAEERIAKLWSGAYAKAGEEIAEVAAQSGGKTASSFNKAALDAAEVSDKATSKLAGLVDQMRQEAATADLSAGATLRYRLAVGDLSKELATGGAAAEMYGDQLTELSFKLDEQAKAQAKATKEQAAWNSMMGEGAALAESVRTPAEKLSARYERLNTLLQENAINQETYNRAVAQAQDDFDKASKGANQFGIDMEEIGRTLGQNIQNSLSDFLFDPFADGTKAMGEQFGDLLKRMAADVAAASIMQGLFGGGAGGGGAGGLLGAIGGLFAGARAEGGPVNAGQPFLVGERGPEMFVPAGQGSIADARETSRMGGQVTVTVNTPNADSFRSNRRQISREIKQGVQT